MIVVLDTNVLVSGLITPHGVCGAILDALAAGAFDAAVCPGVLDEYAEVLHRPHLKIPMEKGAALLSSMGRMGVMVADSSEKFGLPDPDDAIFLAAALAGRADYLVTGNLRHFPQALCRGVTVMSPADFLKLLRESES
jgi:uncharacterized protein